MDQQKKVAFLFPGQGAQYVGMGRDFYNEYALARQTLEEAEEISKIKLAQIIFEGPESELTLTKNSQLAIFVTSVAMTRVLAKEFPEIIPSYCAGLSLGEYTALVAGGFLEYAQAVALVTLRGQFMHEACDAIQGTMAVVMGLEFDVVQKMVDDLKLPSDLWAANFNCPGQVVISGTLKGIERATNAAKNLGAKRVLPLAVHGAFHSGLMEPAKRQLQPYLEALTILKSSVELVMNVPGDFVCEPEQVKKNLIEQVTKSVYWQRGVEKMEQRLVSLYIEIGCGKTLSGMNKRIGTKGQTLSIENRTDMESLAALIG